MGPSGAGKSTLMDILSGYRISGVSGVVAVDGKERDLDEFRRQSCYITQDDRLQALLTVQENMRAAADLKLHVSVSAFQKNQIINEILSTLGLSSSRNTRAGDLSGGQKKRLSIALELVNNPLVMFLDEPTTGLDSSSCSQCVKLLKILARQGRTIVCTIHQPSASLFQQFDHVYVLSQGRCAYQGSTGRLVPYLAAVDLPCPLYHNPADYVIELASADYGPDKVALMVEGSGNGRSLQWFEDGETLALLPSSTQPVARKSRRAGSLMRRASTTIPEKFREITQKKKKCPGNLQETSTWNQIKVLLHRGYLKIIRDTTLTHMRLIVNAMVGLMLGVLFFRLGNDGSRTLQNYNLIFSVLVHQMSTNMMLSILTFPTEMSSLIKEHFNRWYSLKSFYLSITISDLPVCILSCTLFSVIVYFMTGQPTDLTRLAMFLTISQLNTLISQTIGLMIGAIFNITNGTFIGPTLTVPLMMFSGFSVNLRDMPAYLYWGTYVSYLRFALEGMVGAVYGMDRQLLDCPLELDDSGALFSYCHYRHPTKMLHEVALRGDQFWFNTGVLCGMYLVGRVAAYLLLRWKLSMVR
ncbi:ATP-binding cassette sub-family G member 4 isoform X2 [Bacillus rossius redtenbacheri]